MRRNIPEILTEVNDAQTKAERIRLLQSYNLRPLRTV